MRTKFNLPRLLEESSNIETPFSFQAENPAESLLNRFIFYARVQIIAKPKHNNVTLASVAIEVAVAFKKESDVTLFQDVYFFFISSS